MRSILASSERYCSEIRKITRPGPAESNETTLWYSITIVRIFSFSTKVAPIQSIVYIALLGFLINAAPLFILPCTTIYLVIYSFVKHYLSIIFYNLVIFIFSANFKIKDTALTHTL